MCTPSCGVMLFSSPPLPLTHFSHLLPVKAIIEHEMKNGIPPNRIILGGFSQVRSGSGPQFLLQILTERWWMGELGLRLSLDPPGCPMALIPPSPPAGRCLVAVHGSHLPAPAGRDRGAQLLAPAPQGLPTGTPGAGTLGMGGFPHWSSPVFQQLSLMRRGAAG